MEEPDLMRLVKMNSIQEFGYSQDRCGTCLTPVTLGFKTVRYAYENLNRNSKSDIPRLNINER
jgi:hypothetical protein